MLYSNEDILTSSDIPIGNKCLYTRQVFLPEYGYTIRGFQEAVFDMLKEVKRICLEEGIVFFLGYGTLLGAVRHNGFIPWDDDVDIMMSREEYNRFKGICRKRLGDVCELVDAEISDQYTFTFPRLRKKDTTYILQCEVANHYCAGIYIDIILYDYMSKYRLIKGLQVRTFKNLHRLVSFGYSQGTHHVSLFEEFFISGIAKVFGKKAVIRLLQRIISCTSEAKSKEVLVNLLLSSEYLHSIIDIKYFRSQKWVEFEDANMPIPQDAEELLDDVYSKLERTYHCNIPVHLKDIRDKYPDNKNYLASYQFVSQERRRARHEEVAFSLEHKSSYFTEYYMQYMDIRKNNLCAVRERRYKERAARYLSVMNKNSLNAAIAIKEQETRVFLRNQKDRIHKDVEKGIYTWVRENFLYLDIVWQQHITQEDFDLILGIMILSGDFEYMLRMIEKRSFLFPDETGDELETAVLLNVTAWYQLCNKDWEEAYKTLHIMDERWQKAVIHKIYTLMEQYEYGKKEEAMKSADELLKMNQNLFIALYYKGIMQQEKGDKDAEVYLKKALNATAFMPFIQMAAERLSMCGGSLK